MKTLPHTANRHGWRGALLIAAAVLWAVGARGGEAREEVTIYDANPKHLWNRLHEALFIRTAPDGTRYGFDEVDPLYWQSTHHLLDDDSHAAALKVLDEFINKHGENLVHDPFKRAIMQHNLWVLFDWAAPEEHLEKLSASCHELDRRLAVIIRRLELKPDEIAALPDNYAQTAASESVTNLPRGMFDISGGWVRLGIGEASPVATTHVIDFGGHSVFLVMVRLPEGRAATLAYLEKLRTFEHARITTSEIQHDRIPTGERYMHREGPGVVREVQVWNPDLPRFPTNTEWALVRRMLVIDSEGRLQPTPITESIQVRRYLDPILDNRVTARELNYGQQFSEFVMSTRQNGQIHAVTENEKGFPFLRLRTKGIDPFEMMGNSNISGQHEDPRRNVLRSCLDCHQQPGIFSVFSYNRVFANFNGSGTLPPALTEASPKHEADLTIIWKQHRYEWGWLQGLWDNGK